MAYQKVVKMRQYMLTFVRVVRMRRAFLLFFKRPFLKIFIVETTSSQAELGSLLDSTILDVSMPFSRALCFNFQELFFHRKKEE